MSGNSLQYSDLEVVSSETRPSDPGIQVKVEPGIILAAQHYDLELAHSVQSSDGDTVGVMRAELMSKEEIIEKKKWNVKTWSRRKWLLVVVLVMTLALIIIIASVIPASSKPTTSSTSESTSTLAVTSGSVTSSTTQSTATKAPTSNLIRNIAAVSYTSDSVNTTRLYYQDNSGQLIEAITSNSSSSTTPTWTTNKLNYTANNGSAIAAAVTKPGLEPMVIINSFPYSPLPKWCSGIDVLKYCQEITLVFVGSNNILHSISSPLNTSASTSWTSGSVSQQNISVYSATRLATLYNPCLDCDYNIIVAYQTFDGNIVIGNQTSVSTSANPSTSIDTIADTNAGDNSADSLGSWNTNNVYCVQLGTGLAFQNKTNKVNNRASLFWQWEGVNITASDWYPGMFIPFGDLN